MNCKITDHTIVVTAVNSCKRLSTPPNHFGIEGKNNQSASQMVQK